MSYPSWERRYRVTTIAPGKLDLFVVTLVNGEVGLFDPITAYETAVARAHAFLEKHPCQLKVLPVTGDEVKSFMGPLFDPPAQPGPNDAAERQECIRNLLEIARETNDDDARHDAFDLLISMGAIQR